MRKVAITYCTFMILGFVSFAQTYTTSQFLVNPLLVNPGFTGYYDAMSATGMFRFQSLGVEGAPQTQSISIHSPLESEYVGVGLIVTNETAAVFNQLNILGSGSYSVDFSKFVMSFGLQAGFRSAESQYAQLTTRQPGDPVYQSDIRTTSFSTGFGAYAYGSNFTAGLSIPEFIKPSEEHQEFSRSMMIMGSYLIEINPSIKIKPGTLINIGEDRPTELNINASVIYRDVIQAGLAYRTNGSISTLFQVFVTDQLQITYSYDAFFTDVAQVSAGSHEIGIQYLFKFSRSNVLSPRYF